MDKDALEKAAAIYDAESFSFSPLGTRSHAKAMQSAITAYLEAVGGVIVPREPIPEMHGAIEGAHELMIEAKDEITRLTARVAELEANTIPKLPNCGQYLATDNTGQWHYINHGGTWQGMPDLVADARKRALVEAAYLVKKHPMRFAGQTEDSVRSNISSAILALLDKEEG